MVNLEHFQLLQSGAVMEAPFWEATPSPQQLLQMESYVSWKGNRYIYILKDLNWGKNYKGTGEIGDMSFVFVSE